MWAATHPLDSDALVSEIFGPLMIGGQVVVLPPSTVLSSDALLDALIRHHVTVLDQSPAALRGLVQLAAANDPRIAELSLRTDAAGRFELADSTSGRHGVGGHVGVGFVVLDEHGEPVLPGVPGEVHLSGPGIARGYLGRPDLTAARFVPNPFGPKGSRLYRSGDLGRMMPDGGLESLGSIADHVPLRGFRGEPSEIDGTAPHRTAVAPRTTAEARLVQLWREVLDLDEVGVEDSFFQLGGDSIRVLTLVTRMRAAGFPAAVRDVFEQQTIARLAELLTGRPAAQTIEAPVAPFALLTAADAGRLPDGLTDAYPLSLVQLGMVVQTLTDGDVNAYQSVNSFLVDDGWDEAAFRRAVLDLPARHETLRTSIDLTGYSIPLQLVHGTAEIPLRIVDLRGQDDVAQRLAITRFVSEQGRELFDLTVAPLTRFTVHLLADDRWRITFTQSHAVTEGWSYHHMLMELLSDYRARRDGRLAQPSGLAVGPLRRLHCRRTRRP